MKRVSPSLFLTKADPHVTRALSARRLRANIMFHSLFMDQLLTGDSQFNNNPNLRSLIWNEEPTTGSITADHRDLHLLLKEGYLMPVIRDQLGSLEELRRVQKQQKVENTPSRGYVDFVTECLVGNRRTFSIAKVSDTFRQRTLCAFSPSGPAETETNLNNKTRDWVHKYVLDNDPLLYNSIRKEMIKAVQAGRLAERQRRIADRLIGDCYRHNVPLNIGSNIDVPIENPARSLGVDLVLGEKRSYEEFVERRRRQPYAIRPAVFLSEKFLASLPAEAVLATKGSKSKKQKGLSSYRRVARTLETIRRGQWVNLFDFVNNELDDYLREVEIIVQDFMTNRQKAGYLATRKEAARKSRVKVIQNVGFAAVEWSIFGPNPISILHVAFATYEGLLNAGNQAGRIYAKGAIVGRPQLLVGKHVPDRM